MLEELGTARDSSKEDEESTCVDPDPFNPSKELVEEQAYLVARGVRPMALLGRVEPEEHAMLAAFITMSSMVNHSSGMPINPIPFVVPTQDGSRADVGFAAEPWVIDLLKWARDNVSEPHLSRIVGLLLGYSPAAIAASENHRFTCGFIWGYRAPASKGQDGDTSCKT